MLRSQFFFQDNFIQYEELIKANGGQNVLLRRKTIIEDVTASKHYAYLILQGIAKLSVINEDGLEQIMFFLSKGSIYPLILDDQQQTMEKYLVMSAVTDLEAIRFPANTLSRMMEIDSSIAYSIIQHYVRYTNLLLCRTLLNSYNDSEKCICSFLYLYKVCCESEKGKRNNLSQEQIGQMLGLSRVQVTRVLSNLRKEGIIKTARNSIEIMNMEGLMNRCSDVVRA